jgi:hypothetical protein
MSLMSEYIAKGLNGPALEAELQQLVAKYNERRGRYLFVYAAALRKQIPGVSLEQDDYYIFHDMLSRLVDVRDLDVYLETPGGSGETAEEIVRFLRTKFGSVSFVVPGEAKSAGTIMVMAGDEILMTETGSLGPIDAQVRVGRYWQSAYDYMEWVSAKRSEAEKAGRLNPFDATMVAQITPGELLGVSNSLRFAEDLVEKWLTQYKFGRWTETETRKLPVTPEMRKQRAREIARDLNDRKKWWSHGQSVKAQDLEGIGLRITRLDRDASLADLVYRIQTVCRILFETTGTFKVFATADSKLFRVAAPLVRARPTEKATPDAGQMEIQCPQCSRKHHIYAKFIQNAKIDSDLQAQGYVPFPQNLKLTCVCGNIIDLSSAKDQMEAQAGRKIVF